MCHLYINLCIYKKLVGVVVSFLLSVLRQAEVVWNLVLFFKKCGNPQTSKLLYLLGILGIVYKIWFNMFFFCHFDLFYVFAQFLAKNSVFSIFFSIFLLILMQFLILSGANFITNMVPVSEKNIQDIIC